MAITFVQSLFQGADKTSSNQLIIGVSRTITAGDDVFIAVATDPQAGSMVVTDNHASSPTYSLVRRETQTGDVESALFRSANYPGGSVSQWTLTLGNAVTARAMCGAVWTNVDDEIGTDAAQASNNAECLAVQHANQPWLSGDLVIGAFGFEGPTGDTHSATFTGSFTTSQGNLVFAPGTTGGGAAGNITCCLAYGIATADSTTGDDASVTAGNNRDNTGAGAVYREVVAQDADRDPYMNAARVYDPALAKAILRSRGR